MTRAEVDELARLLAELHEAGHRRGWCRARLSKIADMQTVVRLHAPEVAE